MSKLARAETYDFRVQCSICGLPEGTDKFLVLGLNGSVCNQCVDEIQQVFELRQCSNCGASAGKGVRLMVDRSEKTAICQLCAEKSGTASAFDVFSNE